MNKSSNKLFKTYSLGFFIFISLVYISCGQTNNVNSVISTKRDKVQELVSLYTEYEGFNGSVLVAQEGEIIYKNGFGFADMEWDIPNQVDTKFQIASITKTFTAMLIMQLVAENTLDLHKPISTYLPDYPKENGEQITLHHLLTHSSGLGRNNSDDKKYNRPKDMVNQFADAPLQFKPGERFEYKNSGYTLLGYIIETVTKKSYEDVLKEKIFTPLNMKNSGYYRHRTLIKKMATGHYKSFGEYYNSDVSDESTAYAAGAIYSTIEDLFLWDQALNTETLLPEKYMSLIFKKHISDPSYDGHYGYGWEFIDKPIGNTQEIVETVGHSGSIGGFRALYTKIPSSNSTIIFLNNTSKAYLTSMTTAITGILYDKPYDFPKKPIAKFMSEVIEKEGIEKGIQFYKDHKDLDDYYISETELIVAGYRFLHAGNAKEAAEVFKLSTEVFPDRDNPYDSYAEALKALGKNADAIINYKKSLELNPKNNNAIEMLKELGVNYTSDVLEADSSWGKELFKMPLHFAEDINLKGVEDARFPKGWIDEKSPNFWSYAFAWNVYLTAKLTRSQIEEYTRKYYDGLLEGINKDKDYVVPKTIVDFHENEDSSYTGELTIYDAFTTKNLLKLNAIVTQSFCEETNKSIILFQISPAAFDKEIWIDLKKIKPREHICD